MKKTKTPLLKLKAETIRTLDRGELFKIAGGYTAFSNCYCEPQKYN